MAIPDGYGTGQSSAYASNTTQVAASLTTSQNGVVVAIVYNLGSSEQVLALSGPGSPSGNAGGGTELPWAGNSTSVSPIEDSSGQNLTWNLLTQIQDPYGHGSVQIYYAVTTAPFNDVTITAYFPAYTETAAMMVFGLDNINIADPLDASSKLPLSVAFEVNTGAMAFTTDDSPDLGILIFTNADNNEGEVSSITAGWTNIGTLATTQGLNYNCCIQAYYQQFTGPQNTLNVDVVHAGGTADGWELSGFAFQIAEPPVTRSRTTLIGF